MEFDKMVVENIVANKMVVHKILFDKMVVGKMEFDKIVVWPNAELILDTNGSC
jgi:hypothetical protein